MRRRNEARVRSSAGQVGSHGTRKSREAARSATHSAASDIWGGRNMTPSPVIAGAASGRLTVRKNAMALSGRTMLRARNSAMSSTPPLHPTRPPPTPGPGSKCAKGGPPPGEQRPPRGEGAHTRPRLHLGDDLVEGDRAAPGDDLAGKLLGARARALEGHEEARLHLRLGAGDLGVADR